MEGLLLHGSSLLRGAPLLCLERLLLCGGVFSSVERRSRCCYNLLDVLLPELAWCLPLAWSLTHGGPLRGRWRAATRQVAGRYAAEELEWEPFHKTFLFPPGAVGDDLVYVLCIR